MREAKAKGKQNLNQKQRQRVKQNLKINNLILIYRMGSSSSKKETSNIDRIKDIAEDELDLSNIDRLQIKALKELNEKIIKMEKEKSDKIDYKLPAINLCSNSLF